MTSLSAMARVPQGYRWLPALPCVGRWLRGAATLLVFGCLSAPGARAQDDAAETPAAPSGERELVDRLTVLIVQAQHEDGGWGEGDNLDELA